MSWSITVKGNAEEIGKAFDAQREQSASWGMIEAEQRDIDEARDLAMHFASKYDRVTVTASGHWNTFTDDDPLGRKSAFGRVSITIEAAPVEATAQPPEAKPDVISDPSFTQPIPDGTVTAGAATFTGVSTPTEGGLKEPETPVAPV